MSTLTDYRIIAANAYDELDQFSTDFEQWVNTEMDDLAELLGEVLDELHVLVDAEVDAMHASEEWQRRPDTPSTPSPPEPRFEVAPRAAFAAAEPFDGRASLDQLAARQARPTTKPAETLEVAPEPPTDVVPEPEHVLSDVAPRRGGKYRRTDRPGWLQRLREAWADETGAPA